MGVASLNVRGFRLPSLGCEKTIHELAGLAQVGVITADPVLAWRREDIEVNRIFEGLG